MHLKFLLENLKGRDSFGRPRHRWGEIKWTQTSVIKNSVMCVLLQIETFVGNACTIL
jgi:hypothetical protein